MHIDATSDEDYPLRILRAYYRDTLARTSHNTAGNTPQNPVFIMMNQHQAERAQILDRAIRLLEAAKAEEVAHA